MPNNKKKTSMSDIEFLSFIHAGKISANLEEELLI
jgi:hypothetical protein